MYEEFSGINWDIITSIGTFLMAVTNVILVIFIYHQTELTYKNLRLDTIKAVAEVKPKLDKIIQKELYNEGLNMLQNIPGCNPSLWSNISQVSRYKEYIGNIMYATLLLQFLADLLKKIPNPPLEQINRLEEISQLNEYSKRLLQELVILEAQYNNASCHRAQQYNKKLQTIGFRINEILLQIEKHEPLLTPVNILENLSTNASIMYRVIRLWWDNIGVIVVFWFC